MAVDDYRNPSDARKTSGLVTWSTIWGDWMHETICRNKGWWGLSSLWPLPCVDYSWDY